MTDITLETPLARFVMVVDDHRCELDFTLSGQTMDIRSVRVPKAVGGRGLAGQLTRHALDWANARSLKVKPTCPYVASWLERHPEHDYSIV
jgi:predicted GNAT family acetyltransferase